MQVLTSGDRTPIGRLSLSGCGRWLLAARPRKVAILWDRTTVRVAHRFAHLPMAGAMVHPDGRAVFVWGPGGLLRIELGSGTEQWVEPREPVYWLVADAGGHRLVGAVEDGFTAWEAADGLPRPTWRVARNGFLSGPFVVSPGGEWFAARATGPEFQRGPVEVRATAGGKLRAAGVVFGELVGLLDYAWPLVDSRGRLVIANLSKMPADEFGVTRPLSGRGPITAAVSPDGATVLAARDKAVYLLAADTLAVRRTYTFPTAGRPTCVAFAPDGLTAACGTSKGEVVIWDVD